MTDDDDIQDYVSDRDTTNIRNQVLEEVAREFEKMKVFEADTMASIAVHIRSMKNEWFR